MRDDYVRKAKTLMVDTNKFERAMVRAIDEWPRSSEHNLSASTVNRLAWIGHAASYLATGSPEELTRIAWHLLSEPKQAAANEAASRTVLKWEARFLAKQDDECQKHLWE